MLVHGDGDGSDGDGDGSDGDGDGRECRLARLAVETPLSLSHFNNYKYMLNNTKPTYVQSNTCINQCLIFD
ncbi:hypothetical protein M0804_008207 [Polistes exclamans]|nr:hypothetical protein M0804_008207 [Polistes exclamans]